MLEMVCPCGLHLPSGTPLPISVDLGFIDRPRPGIGEPTGDNIFKICKSKIYYEKLVLIML
jgi:hypothetical protein